MLRSASTQFVRGRAVEGADAGRLRGGLIVTKENSFRNQWRSFRSARICLFKQHRLGRFLWAFGIMLWKLRCVDRDWEIFVEREEC
jgi:hypothetical protein